MSVPSLLVGIDTESDNQWTAAARAEPTFENLYALPTLHELFRRHGVQADVPDHVARRARRAIGRRPAGAARGRHVRDRRAPPRVGDAAVRARRRLHATRTRRRSRRRSSTRKLSQLTERHRGRPSASGPVSYRSGRFGFSAGSRRRARASRVPRRVERGAAVLRAHKGGPDFADAPLRPYFLAYDDATRPGTSQVLEVPVSCGLSRRWPHALQVAWTRAPQPYTTKRYLRKLGVVRSMWLRPSYSSLDDMIALARRLAADGEPALNVIFHSSEIIVGGSPYNRTAAELDAFLDRLDRFLAAATRELRADPAHVPRVPRPILRAGLLSRALLTCASATSRRTCRPTRRPTRCCRTTSGSGRRPPGTRSTS